MSEDYSAWIGRTETVSEPISAERVAQLAATLDMAEVPGLGTPLPSAWQWLYFNPAVRQSELGLDGHPRRGGFLPPIDLPRRMWAGSRITYHAPLAVGALARKTSEILKVETKSGKSGSLVFVTVRHGISANGQLCIEEEQDLVYRSPPEPGAPPAPGKAAPASAQWSEAVMPTAPLLFRYSALTFNGHRIHYDAPYAVEEEGYPGLVVQGPLTATLLQGLAVRARPGARLAQFSFRGMSPLFAGRPFHIEAAEVEGNRQELSVWARMDSGELAMQATAVFAGGLEP